jgi:hypothetical protein
VLRLRQSWFTEGRSKFLDAIAEFPEPTAKIYVKLRISASTRLVYAQVDTAAAWSVLPPDVAQNAGIPIGKGEPALLSTRFGMKHGHLVRATYTLIADEGESLFAEGSFFVCPDWPSRRVFLGYSGLLDSFRFALDPQVNDFYFGPC